MRPANIAFRVALLSFASIGVAHAQHSVRVATEIERVENPLLAPVNPGGATVIRISPSYIFETESDRIRSRFSMAAVLERSSNTQLLANRNYPSLGYTWGYTWPTASLELRASLAEAATRNTELRDFGRVTVDSRERTLAAGATWNKELTERTRLTVGLENHRVSYDSALLQDYREQELTTRLSWEATERATYFVEPGYARLTPSGLSPESTLNRWLVGATGQLTPEWSLTAFAGQARTGSARKVSNNVGGLRLAYAEGRLTSELELARDMEPVGTIAAYARTETARARVAYQLTESATVTASMAKSRTVGTTGGIGSVFALSLENQLAENWMSMLGVEDRKSKDALGLVGKGWAVRAGLVYLFSSR
ncbi:hypothetical protein [Hydrogenophaga sp.]